jgi:hypothetical protein
MGKSKVVNVAKVAKGEQKVAKDNKQITKSDKKAAKVKGALSSKDVHAKVCPEFFPSLLISHTLNV